MVNDVSKSEWAIFFDVVYENSFHEQTTKISDLNAMFNELKYRSNMLTLLHYWCYHSVCKQSQKWDEIFGPVIFFPKCLVPNF